MGTRCLVRRVQVKWPFDNGQIGKEKLVHFGINLEKVDFLHSGKIVICENLLAGNPGVIHMIVSSIGVTVVVRGAIVCSMTTMTITDSRTAVISAINRI
jgi:hypothetical protein